MKKMTQEKVIAKTKEPLSQMDIEQQLSQLGLKKGDIVLLHASLSSFGFVIGGEIAVINALRNVIGSQGTLVFPTQSTENSDPSDWCNPPVPKEWFDKIKMHTPPYNRSFYTVRGMGRIPSALLQIKESVRSNHPQVSFGALGKKAKKICSRHELQPQFGINTPLGTLYGMKAKVLLLGVGYDKGTCFHLSEVLSNQLKTEKVGCRVQRGTSDEWIHFIDFDYDNDDFDNLGNALEKEIKVNQVKIGNAECRCFDFKKAVDFGTRWIIRNRGH